MKEIAIDPATQPHVTDETSDSGQTGISVVPATRGQRLIKRGDFFTSLVVGVKGRIKLVTEAGPCPILEAPFVVDSWAADRSRRSVITAIAETDSVVLLVNWDQREALFAGAGHLQQTSNATHAHIRALAS